jgi:hypothetical protein
MTKTDTFIGILGWIAAAVVTAILLMNMRHRNQDKAEYQSILQEKQDSIRYHRSSTGQLVASKMAAEADRDKVIQAYGQELAEIRKTFGIEAKNIRSFVKAQFAAQGYGTTIVRDTVFIDSTGIQISEHRFVLDDGYLSMEGRFRANSGLSYKYSYRDSITIVSHLQKHGLFKPRRLYVDAAFANPNNKITNLHNIQVTDYKDKRFGIGPYVGYDVLNNRLAAGVSVHYSLIRF